MKTVMTKEADVQRRWLLVDATDKVLGRMATSIAMVLMGKHRPQYTPSVDTGEFVVVINAEKVRLTGKKATDKVYKRYTGYPGGLRLTPYGKVLEKHPERIVREAVRRMLPKGTLGKQMLTKLKVYAGAEHPHAAQGPEAVELKVR